MSVRESPRVERYTDHYETTYGDYVVGTRLAGNTGAVILRADQTAGDWSDPAVPELVIATVVAGRSRFDVDLGAGRLPPARGVGDTIVVAPHVATSIQADGWHSILSMAVPYERLAMLAGADEPCLPPDGDFGRLHADWIRDRQITGLLTAIWNETIDQSPCGALFADGALLQLTSRLLRLHNGRDGSPVVAAHLGRGDRRLRRAVDYLDERLGHHVGLTQVAAEVGLSSKHLTVLFKAELGQTPHQWLMRRRCERACELLANRRLTVTEIAYACGFASSQHFATTFKKQFGVTPSQYRRVRLT